jgi:hypothetical protein
MFQIIKSISILILAAGGIIFALVDLFTGKITDDPLTRKRIHLILYIIFIVLAVSLIIEKIEFLINYNATNN